MIRAWRHPGGGALLPLVPDDRPDPVLQGDQVLVAVHAAVLGQPERAVRTAYTPGGAGLGKVVAAGESAAHMLGQQVVLGPEQPCGECDVCRRGAAVVCPSATYLGRTADGTLASVVVARARWLCALERDLHISSPAAALIGREAAWAYALFTRAGAGPGEPVVIVGDDIVARLLAEVSVAKGVKPMVVTARPGFAAWIEACGGVPVTADPEAVAAAALRGGHGKRPWLVFETSAMPEHRALAMSLAGPGTRVTLLSAQAAGRASHDASSISPELMERLLARVIDLDGLCIGVAGAHPDLLPEVAALAVRGDLDLAAAAEVVSLEHAMARAGAGGDHDSDSSSDSPPRALVVTLPDAGFTA